MEAEAAPYLAAEPAVVRPVEAALIHLVADHRLWQSLQEDEECFGHRVVTARWARGSQGARGAYGSPPPASPPTPVGFAAASNPQDLWVSVPNCFPTPQPLSSALPHPLLPSPEPHRPFLPLAQPCRSSPRAELLRGCPAPRGGAPLQGQKGASPQARALPEEADKRSSESDLTAQLRFNGFRGTPGAARIRIVSGILVSRQSMICCSSSCMPGVWNRSSCQRQRCRRRARTSHTFLTEAEAHGDSRVGAGSPAGASSRGEKPCPANTPLELISRRRPHPSPGGKRA